MKAKIETTHKTTVTFSVKDFLNKLGLERSGDIQLVFIRPQRVLVSFGEDRIIEAQVDIIFQEETETRELEQ